MDSGNQLLPSNPFSYSSKWNPVWCELVEVIPAVNALGVSAVFGPMTGDSLLFKVHIIKNGGGRASNIVSKI